jgi:isocitrate dehydrogenase
MGETMQKTRIRNPIVEMDGDEMTRIIWAAIKERLILPWLEIELEYYDLGLPNRDASGDRVTAEAARAVLSRGVGVKCATITPDAERVAEYNLKEAWPSPNVSLRSILGGTMFRTPIVAANIEAAVRSWKRPITVGRHAYGDLHRAVELVVPGPGQAELVYRPAAGGEETRLGVHDFEGSGVLMAMHNTDASITAFARASVSLALSERIELWFAAKDTVSRRYHGRFRELFAAEVEARRAEMEAAGIGYRYLLIDDAMAQVMKHPGGILWACMNYEGDIISDFVGAGFGSLGMMSSVLVSPGGACYYEAAHGTVRRHYYEHLAGKETSTNPVASIFAWTRAIRRRGELDGTADACAFSAALEKAVISTLEAGTVTSDLLGAATPRPEAAASTGEFIEAVAARLEAAMRRPAP